MNLDVFNFSFFILNFSFIYTSICFLWHHRCVAILSSAYQWGTFIDAEQNPFYVAGNAFFSIFVT